MATMKAARWHAAKDVRVEEIPIPVPGKNQIKIAVKFAGICGSDLHEYAHGPMLIMTDTPHPLTGHQSTVTLGHEFSGIVVETGEGVTKVKPGDRVVVEPIYYCRKCVYCRSGNYNRCEVFGCLGLHSDGGFAEYVIVENHMVHLIPDSMSFEQGALAEPASVAVQAVRKSGLKEGDSCVVFGAGPIGLLTMQAAKAYGASKVYVVDIAEARLEQARQAGATEVFDARDNDVPEQILLANGGGTDFCFDAAGVQQSFSTGLQCLRKGGTLMIVAIFGKPVELNALDIMISEKRIEGSLGFCDVFPEVIRLIDSGKMDVLKLVTSKISLDNIVGNGFESLINNPSQTKILIDMK